MTTGLSSTYRCNRCDRYLEQSALRKVPAGGSFMLVCPMCGDLARKEESRVARSLPALLASAFLYPFRGGTVMWVVALLVVMTLVRFVPFVGGLLAFSAEVGLLFAVLKSTAAGHADLNVSASDLADVSGWLGPLFRYIAAVLVSFGPAIGIAFAFRYVPFVSQLAYALGGLGLLYFPAALVVAAHTDGCLGVLNPAAGFAFIGRIPGPYFITVAFLAVAVAVGAGMMTAAASISVPLASVIARGIASIYGPLVGMRMLGLLIEEHAEEL